MTDAATRFRVWRSYHRLEDDLGRIPTTREVAKECGISPNAAWLHMRTLKSCRMREEGEKVRVFERRDEEPSVDTFINSHGGA